MMRRIIGLLWAMVSALCVLAGPGRALAQSAPPPDFPDVWLTRCQPVVNGNLNPNDPSSPGFGNTPADRKFRVHYVLTLKRPTDSPESAANSIQSIRVCSSTSGCPDASPWVIFDRSAGIGSLDPARVAKRFSEVTDKHLAFVDLPIDWDSAATPDQLLRLQITWVDMPPDTIQLPDYFHGSCAKWERLGTATTQANRTVAVFGVEDAAVANRNHCTEGYTLQWRSPGDECAGEHICNGACTNLKFDARHCGQCKRACNATQGCNDGACRACTASETLCGGICVNTQTDANHCGGCGASCAAGQACQAGACVAAGPGVPEQRTPRSSGKAQPFCFSPTQGEFLAKIVASADDAQRDRLQGGLGPNAFTAADNKNGPFHALVGPQVFGGGTALAPWYFVDSPDAFPVINPQAAPAQHHYQVFRLTAHEYFHSLQDVWHYHHPKFGLPAPGYTGESLADQMIHHLCFQNFPDATGMTAPDECVSQARLHGHNANGQVLETPANGRLLTTPYASSIFWQYLSSQFSYPITPGSLIHPSGINSTIPRQVDADITELFKRRFTDEGYDFIGSFFDTVKDMSVGPFEGLKRALPQLLGREFGDVLFDFHTAIYLKDYTDFDPRWRFDFIHQNGYQAATKLSDGKPFAVPADVTGATCGGSNICDGFKRALRAYDSYKAGGTVVRLEDGQVVSSDLEGGAASVGLFGTNAVSVVTHANLVGKTVTVRAAAQPNSGLRFRLFEIQEPAAAAGQLVPRPVCGTAPNFECALVAEKETGRLRLAQSVSVNSETRELILIASSQSTRGCARGWPLDPPDSGTGTAASCERFDWSFGTPVTRVSILRPTGSRAAHVGSGANRQSFLAALRLLDSDDQPVDFKAEDIQLTTSGCAAANCQVPKENIVFIPATDGTVLAVVTLPASFYPAGAGSLDLFVRHVPSGRTDVETNAMTYSNTPATQSVALVLDKSGSMGFFDGVKLKALKIVGSALVTAMLPVDAGATPTTRLGLVTFNQDADTEVPLNWLSATNQADYFTAIANLMAGGGTSLGDALFEAQSALASDHAALTAAGNPGTDGDAMILVSDGVNESDFWPNLYWQKAVGDIPTNDGRGSPWFAAQPLDYPSRADNGLRLPLIEGIAIGQDADLATLEQLTRLSGGKPLFIEGAVDGTALAQIVPQLSGVMLQSLNGATGFQRTTAALLNGPEDPIEVPRATGPSSPTELRFNVEQGAHTLRVTVIAPRSGGSAGTLSAPDGATYASVGSTPDGSGRAFRVENPLPGVWKFSSSATETAVADILVEAAVRSPGQLFSIVDVKQRDAEVPAPVAGSPVVIRAVPVEISPISGCTVTATVKHPDGVAVEANPTDDGSGDDQLAGDGIYTLTFRDTRAPGNYTVQLRAECTSPIRGTVFRREVEDGFILAPAPDGDSDGIPDAWETGVGLDPTDPSDASEDQDGDGLTAGQEYAAGTNPFFADTDGGGLTDGSEVSTGSDPLDGADDGSHTPVPEIFPGDGVVLINPIVGLDGGRTLEIQSAPAPEGPWTTLTEAWQPGDTVAVDRTVSNGDRVCYRLRTIEDDRVGDWTVPTCTTPDIDPTPPSVSIEPVGPTCGLRFVRLQLTARDLPSLTDVPLPVDLGALASGVAEMRIWFGSDGPGDWHPYTSQPLVKLPNPEGPLLLNVQVRDQAGKTSSVASQVLGCTPIECPLSHTEPAELACCYDLSTCSDSRRYAIYATESLFISNSTRVTEPNGTLAPVVNAGTGLAHLGVSARVGSLLAGGSVFASESAVVEGALVAAGTLTRQNNVTIGSLLENQTLSFRGLSDLRVTIPSNHSGDVRLEPNQVRSLAPGSYGEVLVKQGARLKLRNGVYFFRSFSLESQGTIELSSTDDTPVYTYVKDSFTVRGTVTTGGAHDRWFVGYVGQQMASIEKPFSGTIVAPQATIALRGPTGTIHRGSFFARRVEVEPTNVRVIRYAFGAPWNAHPGDLNVAGERWEQSIPDAVERGGCGCRSSRQGTGSGGLLALACMAMAFVRRRSRSLN